MPTVYDSTNALDIPVTPPGEGAFMAGYADGRWPSYSEMVARYPLATIFSIAVGYGTHAYWCDRETLDLSPQQAALQIKNQFSTGIYVDSSSWPAVESAVASLSLPIPPYWIAQYDGDQPSPPTGSHVAASGSSTSPSAPVTMMSRQPSQDSTLAHHRYRRMHK